MIDRFSKLQFEAALPRDKKTGKPLWIHNGFVDGEYTYSVEVNKVARVRIRSTVTRDGFAKDTGEDSIRLWVEVLTENGQYKPLPKIDSYTTRVKGWEKRMVDKIRELYAKGLAIKRTVPVCEKCNKIQPIWQIGAGPNKDRWCSKCIDCEMGFTFMDMERKEDGTWERKSDTTNVPPVANMDTEPAEKPSGIKSPEVSGNADSAKSNGSSSSDENNKSSQESDDIFAELNELANKEFEAPSNTHKIASNANSQQVAAIEAPMDRAVRVLAGPGSGKTWVIERRYAHLLANGVKPQEIVAVTFSAAMAQELQGRIMKHNKEVSGSGAENQICTIHALCNRIVTAEGKAKQIPKTWQMKKMLQEIIAELWEYTANAAYARPGWDEVLRAFANAKGNYLLVGQDASFYERIWGEYHAQRLTEARKRFDGSMQAQGLWMFNDMLYECEKLLVTDKAALNKYQTKYQYIIIDEGQDTNHQAMRILTLLAQPQNQLFIVGDPDQLLFRFTGATPESNLYDGFTKRYPDGLMFMLETNYRSTAKIVERSNWLIEKNYQGMGGPYNEVFHKILNPRQDAEVGKDVHYQTYLDPADEGEAVAEQVALMIEQGREPGEIFIGSRTRAQLGYLEGPLTRMGVKFINITGGSFWQMSHIANTIAYLRLVHNNDDSESFQKVYNIASKDMRNRDREYCPTRYLGRAFLEEVGNKYDVRAMQEACQRRWAYTNGVDDLIGLMTEIEVQLAKSGPGQAIRTIIDLCMTRFLQHEEGLDGSDSENSKVADLETVIDVASQFKTVEEFLDRIDEMIQAAQDAREKKWDDYVVLSTIHRLKGMERPVVFGLGWSEGEMVTADGHVVKVGLLPHTFSLMPPPKTGVLDITQQSAVEDERCMAFVLVTRAKAEVYLSGIQRWRKAIMRPSRFIAEMGLLTREQVEESVLD